MAAGNFTSELVEAYNSFLSTLSQPAQSFINLFLLVLLVVIYSIFIWKFYRFISTRNILGLNLSQYNKSEHPLGTRLLAGGLYLAEYIIILPFLIFFWFSVFTIFLIFLTENLELQTILLISVTIIAAIRMTSYIPNYGENLSKEIAKLFPFTLLAISLLNPSFFDFERVISHLSQLRGLFSVIFNYLIFIIILEIFLRFFEFLFSILGFEDVVEAKKREEKEEEEREEND